MKISADLYRYYSIVIRSVGGGGGGGIVYICPQALHLAHLQFWDAEYKFTGSQSQFSMGTP